MNDDARPGNSVAELLQEVAQLPTSRTLLISADLKKRYLIELCQRLAAALKEQTSSPVVQQDDVVDG